MIRGATKRLLPFIAGYPRRFSLFLDADEREGILKEFQNNLLGFEMLQKIEAQWVDFFTRRSLFQRHTNQMVELCLLAEGGVVTERFSAGCPGQSGVVLSVPLPLTPTRVEQNTPAVLGI